MAPSAEGEVDGKLPGSQEGIALVGGRLERARSADSSDLAPASTSLAQVLAELGVSEAGDGRRRETIAEAAYGGTLTLSRLRVLRRAGLLPYDVADLPPDESG